MYPADRIPIRWRYAKYTDAKKLVEKARKKKDFVRKHIGSYEDIAKVWAEVGSWFECAGDAFMKGEKYGPAEKAYKEARKANEISLKESNLSSYDATPEKIMKARDKRLLKIGKYLGKRESREAKKKKGGLEAKLPAVLLIGILGIGLYYLFSNDITGSVVTNLNSVSSGFLINFILVGILGLIGYFYLK